MSWARPSDPIGTRCDERAKFATCPSPPAAGDCTTRCRNWRTRVSPRQNRRHLIVVPGRDLYTSRRRLPQPNTHHSSKSRRFGAAATRRSVWRNLLRRLAQMCVVRSARCAHGMCFHCSTWDVPHLSEAVRMVRGVSVHDRFFNRTGFETLSASAPKRPGDFVDARTSVSLVTSIV